MLRKKQRDTLKREQLHRELGPAAGELAWDHYQSVHGELVLTHRVTSQFIQALPPQIVHCDAYLYAVVGRKPDKILPGPWGTDVRLDPCFFDWERQLIEITIPSNINKGITSADDLDPGYFEAVQAAFIALIHSFVA